MAKQLKDYIHYYIGCEVELAGSNVTHPRKGIFLGVTDLSRLSCRIGFRSGPEGRINTQFIKPLLRKLSSMSEEELLELIDFKKFTDRQIIRIEKEENLFAVFYRWPAKDLNDDGYGYSSTALYFDKEEWTPDQFHYLLSKGYWLFGNDWFDEGLIIDKKTLKQ